MKVLLTQIQREWAERTYHMIIFAVVFLMAGLIIPHIYYEYLDRRQYITVEQPVTYNKKAFKPCETAVAVIKYTAVQDLALKSRVRVYKVEPEGNRIILEVPPTGQTPTETFVKKTPITGDKIVTRSQVPCDYEPGTYFYEAFLTYEVRGALHHYSYISTQVEIVEE